MSTTATELERLVVRLVGDGSDYEKTLDDAVADTKQASKEIEDINKKAASAWNATMHKAASMTKAVQSPTEQYTNQIKELDSYYKSGMISAQTYNRQVKALNKTFNRGAAGVMHYGKRIAGVGRTMRNTGAMATIGMTLPILGMGAAFLKSAADAEETQNKYDVVFSSVAAQAKASAKVLDDSYGMANEEAKALLATTGDLLTGFGFSQKAALDLSTRVQKLAVDLASFQNLEGGSARASEALTKALVGETEQAKALGVVIRQDSDEFKTLVKRFQDTEGMTLLQAKAMTALTIVTNQSKNAIGDYARSQHSATNQTREFLADIKDLAVSFGQVLMPAFRMVLGWARKVVGFMKTLSKPFLKVIVVIAGILAALGPVLTMVGMAVASIGGLVTIIGFLGTLTLATVKIVAIAVAGFLAFAAVVTAVGVAVWQIVDAIWGPGSLVAGLKAALAAAWDFAKYMLGFIMNIRENWKLLTEWLGRNWSNLFYDMGGALVTFYSNMVSNSLIAIKTMVRLYVMFQGFMAGLWERVFKTDFMHWIGVGIQKAADALVGFVMGAWEALKSIFSAKGPMEGGAGGLKKLAETLVGDFAAGMESQNILKDMGKVIGQGLDEMKAPLEGFNSSLEALPEFNTTLGILAPSKKAVDAMKKKVATPTTAPDDGGAKGTVRTGKLAVAREAGSAEAFKILVSQRSTEDKINKRMRKKNLSANQKAAFAVSRLATEGVKIKGLKTVEKI